MLGNLDRWSAIRAGECSVKINPDAVSIVGDGQRFIRESHPRCSAVSPIGGPNFHAIIVQFSQQRFPPRPDSFRPSFRQASPDPTACLPRAPHSQALARPVHFFAGRLGGSMRG